MMEMWTQKEDILGSGPSPRHPTDPQRLHTECKNLRPLQACQAGHLVQAVSHKGMERTGRRKKGR